MLYIFSYVFWQVLLIISIRVFSFLFILSGTAFGKSSVNRKRQLFFGFENAQYLCIVLQSFDLQFCEVLFNHL